MNANASVAPSELWIKLQLFTIVGNAIVVDLNKLRHGVEFRIEKRKYEC
jgi:hypothetical protein